MQFGKYHISTLFLVMAVAFIIIAITTENLVFLSSTAICLIFGIKKSDDKQNK